VAGIRLWIWSWDFFEGFFIAANVAHICGKKTDRIIMKFFSEMCLWTWKSPLNFGSVPEPPAYTF